MARVRITFITLGRGDAIDGAGEAVIDGVVGASTALDVTTTATAAGSRPVAPSAPPGEPLYARIINRTGTGAGTIVVAWGTDPTASLASGIMIEAGQAEVVRCQPGDLFSFIEIA